MLNKKELNEIIAFENSLYEKVKIFKEDEALTAEFFLDFFIDKKDEIKKDLMNLNADELNFLDFIVNSEKTKIELDEYFFYNRAIWKKFSKENLEALEGGSKKYFEEKVFQKAVESLEADFSLNQNFTTQDLDFSRVKVIVNAEIFLEKIKKFEIAKSELRKNKNEIAERKENLSEQKVLLVDFYLDYLERFKIELLSSSINLLKIKEEELSLNEKEILSWTEEVFLKKQINFDSSNNRALIDCKKIQIPKRLSELAGYLDNLKNELVKNAKNKRETKEGKDFTAFDFAEYTKELIHLYGFKNVEVNLCKKRTNLSLSSKYENGKRISIVNIPFDRRFSLREIVSLLAHEIEGHLLQRFNEEKIKFEFVANKLAKSYLLFAEAGAMRNEDLVNQKMAGFIEIKNYHYARAIKKLFEGGNYLDCIKFFYESLLEIEKNKPNFNLEDAKILLKFAIDRTLRIFRQSVELDPWKRPVEIDQKKFFIVNIKDLVYLEQRLLIEELKKHDWLSLIFLGGIDLEFIEKFSKVKLIDIEKLLKQIQTPKYYSLEIWNQIKDQYKAE